MSVSNSATRIPTHQTRPSCSLHSSHTTLFSVPSSSITSIPFCMLFSLLKIFFPWFFTGIASYHPPEHHMLSISHLLALALPLVFCPSTLFIPFMTFIKTRNAGYLPNSHSCFFLANWTWFCSGIHDPPYCHVLQKGCSLLGPRDKSESV